MKSLKVIALTAVFSLSLPVFANAVVVKLGSELAEAVEKGVKGTPIEKAIRAKFGSDADALLEQISNTGTLLLEKNGGSIENLWNPAKDPKVTKILSSESNIFNLNKADLEYVIKVAKAHLRKDPTLKVCESYACMNVSTDSAEDIYQSTFKTLSPKVLNLIKSKGSAANAFSYLVNQVTAKNGLFAGKKIVDVAAFSDFSPMVQRDILEVFANATKSMKQIAGKEALNDNQLFLQSYVEFVTVNGQTSLFSNRLWRVLLSDNEVAGGDKMKLAAFMDQITATQEPVLGNRWNNMKNQLKANAENSTNPEDKDSWEYLVDEDFCGFGRKTGTV